MFQVMKWLPWNLSLYPIKLTVNNLFQIFQLDFPFIILLPSISIPLSSSPCSLFAPSSYSWDIGYFPSAGAQAHPLLQVPALEPIKLATHCFLQLVAATSLGLFPPSLFTFTYYLRPKLSVPLSSRLSKWNALPYPAPHYLSQQLPY